MSAVPYIHATLFYASDIKVDPYIEQAGAELGQAQVPTGIWLYCDYHLLPYID